MTDFQFTSPDGRLNIVAVSDEAQNLVTYQVTADVTGYIGIGFSDANNNRFHNSPVDGFMVAVVDGLGELSDVTSSTTPSVVLDDDNGDYELLESAEVDGVTSFTVGRSLTPDDNQDFPLVVGEDFNLFYALSDNDNIAIAHADGSDDRNFFTAAADGGVVLAGFELDPGLGLLLSVVTPLALLSLLKLFMEFDKGTLREYKVIDRTPAGRVMNTIKRISQRISGGRGPASQTDTLPVVSSHSHPSLDGRPAATSGGRPESLTQRLSMAFGAAKEKLVTVNYSPKSLNNTGCLAELKHFSRVRVSKEMTVFQLFMIMLFTGIALFWVYGEPVEGFLVADAWGYVCISSALLVIIPATRNSLLTYFLMAPFERTIAYHRWLGTFVFIAGAAHTIYYLVEWQQLGILEANLQVEKYQRGFIAMGGLTIVFLTSLGCVRRKAYSFFRIAHYAFFVFFIAGVAHTNTFLVYAALAGIIYFSDIFLRYAFDLSPKQAFALDVLPGEVTRIRFPKSAFKSYAAGQYVFINMPAISRSEWHPFTLSSGPHQDYLEVHIKALGDFTSTLLSAAQNMNSMKQLPKLRVDGPYGRISFNYKRYESIVLIGGGVGVTPMMSVLKDLFQIDVSEVNRRRHPISPYVKNVYFLWVVPSVAPWAWFFDTLKVAMETSKKGSALGYPKLRVKGFCTRPDPKLAGLQNAVAKVKNYTVTEGRPDMENLLDGVEGSIGVGRKRVAVLACGPTALVSSAWDSCLRRSRPGIQFDCHREEFDF